MKKLLLFLIFLPISTLCQINPINFETSGNGSNWSWVVFENDDNPNLDIINNPDPNGINTSSTVAKFTARENGQPWAGCESLHGSDIGAFSLDSSNCIIKIMVYKSKISDVGIKFVDPTSAAQPEIKVSNSVINQWEEITFDFSSRIGVFPINKDQIVIFPDFDLNGRNEDQIILFDNITFSSYNNDYTWECLNNVCQKQNHNSGSFNDSLSCANYCIMQNTTQNFNVNSKKNHKIFNLLGLQINKLESSKISFIRYNDGTVVKKIIIE